MPKDYSAPLPPQISYRTPEAAAYLIIQPATLEQWRWSGKGPPFIKIGRIVRYRISDLDAYLSERVFRSTTEAQYALPKLTRQQ
jgi:hypothetical protein